MAIFSGDKKKKLLATATYGSWRGPHERKTVLSQLAEAGLSAEEALPLIWTKDAGTRKLGVEIFLSSADPQAVESLLAASQEQPPHVQAFVSRLLPRLPQELLLATVDSLLGDSAEHLRFQGWKLVAVIEGEERERYLARAVREAPEPLRSEALTSLVQEGNPVEHVDLLRSLVDSEDEVLANTALTGLSRVLDRRIVTLMLTIIAHTESEERRDIASSYLKRVGAGHPRAMRPMLLAHLASGNDSLRPLAARYLFATGATSQVLLEILVFARDMVGWLRDRVLDALRPLGELLLDPTTALLNHPDAEVRSAALGLAERLAHPNVIEPICKLLGDNDPWLRIAACDVLGQLRQEQAVPNLVMALQDGEARWAAIDALARIGSSVSLKPLAKLLRSSRQELRLEVVQAFASLEDVRTLPLLRAVKEKDGSAEVRTRAAEVLRDLAQRMGE